LTNCIDRGLAQVHSAQQTIRTYVEDVRQVAATLDPSSDSSDQRQTAFLDISLTFHQDLNPFRQHFAKVMTSFAPGLFVGDDLSDLPSDNLDLERWFRHPKSHERRIHGHRHAGVRIVQEGPVLLPVLDAHLRSEKPFFHQDLRPYANCTPPPSMTNAIHRRKVMRKARSTKNLPILLRRLESQYAQYADTS